MCKPATCNTCGKPTTHSVPLVPSSLPHPHSKPNPNIPSPGKSTWWGCGNHVPSVMDSVDKSAWCTCEPRVERDGTEYPPKAST